MNLDELPMSTLTAGVDRLGATFGPPKEIKAEVFMRELQRALRGWTMAEFEAAIGGAISEERYFPRIANIRKHRPPQMSGDGRPEVGAGNVCPSCGSHDYYAGYECGNGVVAPRLRCDCPQSGGGWDTVAARGWLETDDWFLGGDFHRPPRLRAA